MSDACGANQQGMRELRLRAVPRARSGVLVRRPAAEVYEAFVDPAVTTRFWFTDSTGRLEPHADVRWTWSMYDVSADVHVREARPGERLEIEWDGGNGATIVEWTFEARRIDGGGDATYVAVVEHGFTGDGDAVVARALDATIGHTKVLVAAKALLEHDVVLTVVADT